jgi:hypothetical protein
VNKGFGISEGVVLSEKSDKMKGSKNMITSQQIIKQSTMLQ